MQSRDKKNINKEPVKIIKIKEDDKNFENSTEIWICDSNFVKGNFKVKDHCHVTEKFRRLAHRDCNIDVSLNFKIPVGFHNLNIMMHILLSYKNFENSILKQMSYQTAYKNI